MGHILGSYHLEPCAFLGSELRLKFTHWEIFSSDSWNCVPAPDWPLKPFWRSAKKSVWDFSSGSWGFLFLEQESNKVNTRLGIYNKYTLLNGSWGWQFPMANSNREGKEEETLRSPPLAIFSGQKGAASPPINCVYAKQLTEVQGMLPAVVCDTRDTKQAQLPPLHSSIPTVFVCCLPLAVDLPAYLQPWNSGERRGLRDPASFQKTVSSWSFSRIIQKCSWMLEIKGLW